MRQEYKVGIPIHASKTIDSFSRQQQKVETVNNEPSKSALLVDCTQTLLAALLLMIPYKGYLFLRAQHQHAQCISKLEHYNVTAPGNLILEHSLKTYEKSKRRGKTCVEEGWFLNAEAYLARPFG